LSERLTIPTIQAVSRTIVPCELRGIETLNVSPVILVKFGQFVVQEDGGVEVRREIETDATVVLLTHGG